MQIATGCKQIKEIFPIGDGPTYVVPIYQRPYTWEESNITDFLNDINVENDGYYIGNVLLIEKNDHNNSNIKIQEIVDGQQRLTSIALILMAIFYKLHGFVSSVARDQLSDLFTIQSDIKRKLTNENNSVYALRLLKKDSIVFNAIFEFITEKSIFDKFDDVLFLNNCSEIKCDKRRLMWKRFIDILEWLSENCHSYEDIERFYRKMDNLTIVSITCNDLGDAFSIFSSINANGLPLTLIDLMKVEYLSAVGTLDDDLIKIYEEKWIELLDIFSETEKDSNHSKVIQFLQNYYDTFINLTASSITKKEALNEYKKVFARKGSDFIDELIKHAKIFVDIINSEHIINDKADANVIDDINVLTILSELYRMESSSIYPYLMFFLDLYTQQRIALDDLISILTTIKAFYIKRNIMEKPKSSNIRSRVLESIRSFKNISSIEIINSAISSLLKDISVSDEQFKLALEAPLYSKSNSKTLRIILIDLARYYNNGYFSKSREDTLDLYTSKQTPRSMYKWTIEHILPDGKLNYDWIQSLSKGDQQKAEEIQEKYKNTLGNLTLTPYNSEMSNSSFVIKRDYNPSGSEYEGLRSGLFLNESIVDINQQEDISEKIEWTEADIKRRTSILTNLIVELYKL